MYFWNTQQLASDLQEGTVTERQKMWYFFALTILTALAIEVLGWVPNEYHVVTIIAGFVNVAVTTIGLLLCYQANSRGDDREFVVRFICMSWPVALRILAAYIPVLIFVAVITRILLFGGAPGPFSAIFDRLSDGAGVLFYVAYYGIIRLWLITISSGQVEAVSSGS